MSAGAFRSPGEGGGDDGPQSRVESHGVEYGDGDDGRGWEYLDEPQSSLGDGRGMVEEEGRREDSVGGFFEELDESEWMAGEDVDPLAEKIFFGEKVSFSDLGGFRGKNSFKTAGNTGTRKAAQIDTHEEAKSQTWNRLKRNLKHTSLTPMPYFATYY